MQVQTVGIPWYEEADYPLVLEIMTDRDRLPAQYDVWEAKAEAAERGLQSKGHTTVRVVIDPKTFPAWCRKRGLNIDSEARRAFANAGAYRQTWN